MIHLLIISQVFEVALQHASLAQQTQGPAIKVEINNTFHESLLDSGAICSCIKAEFAETLPITRIDSECLSLKSASNHKLSSAGIAIITLKIGNKIIEYPFIMIPDLNVNILLGYDFFESFEVMIDTNNDIMQSPVLGSIPLVTKKQNFLRTINCKKYVTVRDADPHPSTEQNIKAIKNRVRQPPPLSKNGRVSLITTQDFLVPPFSCATIPVQLKNADGDQCVIIIGCVKLMASLGIFVPDMIIDKNTESVMILNISNEEVLLAKNTRCGTQANHILIENSNPQAKNGIY